MSHHRDTLQHMVPFYRRDFNRRYTDEKYAALRGNYLIQQRMQFVANVDTPFGLTQAKSASSTSGRMTVN